jgi:hypothetical protein
MNDPQLLIAPRFPAVDLPRIETRWFFRRSVLELGQGGSDLLPRGLAVVYSFLGLDFASYAQIPAAIRVDWGEHGSGDDGVLY